MSSLVNKHILKGKTFVITGSTDGIGRHTATRLARSGATIVLHGRNNNKLIKTKNDILQEVNDAQIHCYCYDLSSIRNVKLFAEDVMRNHDGIDVLINNAGVFQPELLITEVCDNNHQLR